MSIPITGDVGRRNKTRNRYVCTRAWQEKFKTPEVLMKFVRMRIRNQVRMCLRPDRNYTVRGQFSSWISNHQFEFVDSNNPILQPNNDRSRLGRPYRFTILFTKLQQNKLVTEIGKLHLYYHKDR
ncbi:UNVERIFIED_CONTAM: hypothetical protein RMT77_015786 [Armadillidium vulgare]